MSKPKEKPRGIAFAAWKSAPLSWSLYIIGLRLNRFGWRLEKIGGSLMAYAISRLTSKGAK
jgi:hypothetical protein